MKAEYGEMMSGPVRAILPIPNETARIARTIFGHKNFYILVGDHMESILEENPMTHLTKAATGGVISPLVTFFQYLEGLTDTQANDALRTRIDWKFACHLPVYSALFRESELCEFRQRILLDPLCQREFQRLIDLLIPFDPPFKKWSHDFKIPELVSLVCSVNRFDLVYEAMSQALEVLACRFPVWLRKNALPHWYGRYNRTAPRLDSTASPCQQKLSIQEIDTDIHHLLKEVRRSGSDEIKKLHEIKMLNHIWMGQFEKSSHVLGDECKFLKLNDCDFCSYKERRNLGGKYQ